MHFEPHQLYHIYNQGNNRQQVFFNRENQLFFLKKISTYILPYADVLAWCLMPNHFHLMVYVRSVVIVSEGFTLSETLTNKTLTNENRTFNDSIGLMLRSYTRAINIQQNRTGSLFRKETKAEGITKTDEGITPSFFDTPTGTFLNMHEVEYSYPKICFDYIHQNPVVAGLCAQPEDWEFSSATDYAGLRDGKLINRERAKEFGLV
ncbi:MAG: hypothetical protein PHD04_02120 [Candidatus Pacebacteria bacterium]|nr:hypothetical protein [Candidatus Paceibacterota bacterium]